MEALAGMAALVDIDIFVGVGVDVDIDVVVRKVRRNNFWL